MTKEKAKLTQVQADALASILELYDHYADLIIDRIQDPPSEVTGMSVDLLIRAIYVGFEIKKTPEEVVRDEYERQKESYASSSVYSAGIREGIFFTLDAFGIRVEGVNDDAPTE